MIGHYKRSKYLAEQAVLELIAQRGLPAVIVNPSAPIGPKSPDRLTTRDLGWWRAGEPGWAASVCRAGRRACALCASNER
jgi:nucleoside-diphosphate-sugar epimerase